MAKNTKAKRATTTPRKTPTTAKRKSAASPRPKKTTSRPRKPAQKRQPGRPSLYADELIERICSLMIEGPLSLRTICERPDMPAMSTVMRWLADDEKSEFREQYARAREIQADILAEEILEIADDGRNDVYEDDKGKIVINTDVVARSKLRVDARKWLASKMAPKKYGDKLGIGGAEGLDAISVRQMTDTERAVRLLRLLQSNPEALGKLQPAEGGEQ